MRYKRSKSGQTQSTLSKSSREKAHTNKSKRESSFHGAKCPLGLSTRTSLARGMWVGKLSTASLPSLAGPYRLPPPLRSLFSTKTTCCLTAVFTGGIVIVGAQVFLGTVVALAP